MTTRTKEIIRDSCISFGIGLAGGSIYQGIKLVILKRKTRKLEEEEIRLEKEAKAKLREIQALEEAKRQIEAGEAEWNKEKDRIHGLIRNAELICAQIESESEDL